MSDMKNAMVRFLESAGPGNPERDGLGALWHLGLKDVVKMCVFMHFPAESGRIAEYSTEMHGLGVNVRYSSDHDVFRVTLTDNRGLPLIISFSAGAVEEFVLEFDSTFYYAS